MEVRKPVVAGYFYEAERKLLEEQIKGCFLCEHGPGSLPSVKKGSRKIVGLIVPHAGYAYSGPVAAHSYYSLAIDGIPETFIIIGPNHTGAGSPVAVMKEGRWSTPLGEAVIDTSIAEELVDNKLIYEDPYAHAYEHSVEVQLPFLQFLYKKVKFVPVCMLDQSFEACVELSDAILRAIEGKDVVVIASSDFSHYEPYHIAYSKDAKAIETIKALDAKKFYDRVAKLDISICGYGPITTMMLFSKKVGAKSCEVIKYATSGDITGERGTVVGYCSAKVVK